VEFSFATVLAIKHHVSAPGKLHTFKNTAYKF
jgi:hypothetical protein